MSYTITITRQFGSLGRPIAKCLSEMLNIEYYDRDIVEATAKKLGLPVSVISNEEESAKSPFFRMSYPLGMGTSETQNQIFNEQVRIIKDIADKESCIIVGRCSDYILQERKNNINVYIYAPYETRLRNCIDILHMKKDEAKSMIAKVDKARNSYHKAFAKFLPDDHEHKDVMINSGLLGVEGTAKVIANIVRERFDLPEE